MAGSFKERWGKNMMQRQTTTAGRVPTGYQDRRREISMFFKGKDEVHKTMRRLVRRLERAGIPYAIIGGMALNAHNYRRTTADVDVLLTQGGFDEFRRLHVAKNYVQAP